MPDVPNATLFREGIVTAGTPTPEALEEARELGFKALISLQPFDEPGAREAYEAAKRLGYAVRHIPIAGGDDLTFERAERLDAALDEMPRPILVHCSSANRVGGLLAMRAYHVEDADVESAIELGRAAGMTDVEPAVRERLESARGEPN